MSVDPVTFERLSDRINNVVLVAGGFARRIKERGGGNPDIGRYATNIIDAIEKLERWEDDIRR